LDPARHDGRGLGAGGPLPGESLATPEAALRALVRAVARRDFHGFSRLLTESKRGRLEKAIELRRRKLEAALDSPVEAEGDSAVIQYDPELRIWLRREAGEWRVDDLD
ncbi:MAG: hypothetical protein AABZ30_01625, partial [Myxococcota bacterium]